MVCNEPYANAIHGVDQEELQEKTKPVFAKSLAEEKDIYASGLIM